MANRPSGTNDTEDDRHGDDPDGAASGVARRRGRPSVRTERTERIVDAFIGLVAARGLEGVTLGDVAHRAGVGRPAIRHHVGNRPALVRAAFATLKRRYDERAVRAAGTRPSVEALVDYLFGTAYVDGSADDDLAFAALLVEAQRDPDLAAAMRASYSTTIERIAETARRADPDLGSDDAAAIGYQVLCLAELNVDLQRLGFPSRWSDATAVTAARLLRGDPPRPVDEI